MEKLVKLLIILLLLASVIQTSQIAHNEQLLIQNNKVNAQDQDITKSDPSDVYIEEYAQYERAVGNQRPIQILRGTISWFMLAGITVNFYLNTSDVIGEAKFWDPQFPNDPNRVSYQKYPDRFEITPQGQAFSYEIKAYYDPDEVDDTGFIVIFQTQTVNFPLSYDPQTQKAVYAYTDYTYTVLLPEGAGIVSYAPTDAKLFKKDGRFGLKWQYRHRAMDSKHDPFVGVITYAFDPIYLQFTEIIYQNKLKQQQLKQEEEQQRLQNLALVLLAIFSFLAALLAILLAYLIVKRKFKPKLDEAKHLPRKTAKDVEKTKTIRRKIATLLIITGIMLTLPYLSPAHAQSTIEPKDDRIVWKGQIELFKDGISIETVEMAIPVPQHQISVWVNTSQVISFQVFNKDGGELNYEKQPDRFIVYNPGNYLKYIIKQPYQVANNSGMLVYVNRFWLEFVNPNPPSNGIPYFPADIQYTVILPAGAIVYSASPSDKMKFVTANDGRKEIIFTDTNRQIDAFHDPFTLQVTFSFYDVLDAIENLNSQFEHFKVETQNQQQLIQSTARQLLLIAILAIITPILAFILAYWVFKKRYERILQELMEKTEEELLLEAPQINGLKQLKQLNEKEPWKAVLGTYKLLKYMLAIITHQPIDKFNFETAISTLKDLGYNIDYSHLEEVYYSLDSLANQIDPQNGIPMDEEDSIMMIQDTDELIQEIWKIYRRQKT